MPWLNLRDMSDDDLRAICAHLRHLGPQGEPAPAYALPGQAMSTHYVDFTPHNLPEQLSVAGP